MRSPQISKISHVRIKQKLGISFKGAIWEKLDRKKEECGRWDINDRAFTNEKENEKEKKSSRAKTVCQRNNFKWMSWDINILWKKFRLKDRESFFR